MNALRGILIAFGAGCAGGLANSLMVWAFGAWGINSAFGVSIAPAFTPAWLYPRIVWGGIWGILLLSRSPRRSPMVRGLFFSIAPSLVQLLIIFPYHTQNGVFGLGLGIMTPLFVLIFNAAWGITASTLQTMAMGDRYGRTSLQL